MKSSSTRTIELELFGKIPSKKNRYQRNPRRNRPFKDRELARAIDDLVLQIPPVYRNLRLEHPDITVQFGFDNFRQDRDNALTTLLDVLVVAGVLADDSTSRCNGTITLLPAVRSEVPFSRVVLRLPESPQPSTDACRS